jgi:hypothetical protein
LWSDKVYVPKIYQAMRHEGKSKEAYLGSIQDSTRSWIKKEELCEFVWNFRFKEAAGHHWLESDPWYVTPKSLTLTKIKVEQ